MLDLQFSIVTNAPNNAPYSGLYPPPSPFPSLAHAPLGQGLLGAVPEDLVQLRGGVDLGEAHLDLVVVNKDGEDVAVVDRDNAAGPGGGVRGLGGGAHQDCYDCPEHIRSSR